MSAAPGSVEGVYLIVADIEAARAELVARGIEVSDVPHEAMLGARFRAATNGRLAGPAPDRASYGSFASRSAILTATAGSFRKSQPAFRGAWTHSDQLRNGQRSGERASPRSGRPRRTREAHGRGGHQVARLVHRVHEGKAEQASEDRL